MYSRTPLAPWVCLSSTARCEQRNKIYNCTSKYTNMHFELYLQAHASRAVGTLLKNGRRSLRAISYFSMSQCATGPARERKVCPGRSVSDGRIRTSAAITAIRRLPGDSAPLGSINATVSRQKGIPLGREAR